MTNEEAIKELKEDVCDLRCHGFDGGCFDDCFAYLAIEALEKQTPKKPVVSIDATKHTIYECKCGELLRTVSNARTFKGIKCNYCRNCGQAIDWSEDEVSS